MTVLVLPLPRARESCHVSAAAEEAALIEARIRSRARWKRRRRRLLFRALMSGRRRLVVRRSIQPSGRGSCASAPRSATVA